ncbi:hypothetical protein ON010_g11005 [Phytophthora cinnamomi]|nr:hypothetical protein ON010_g11005 [Phytophthora cinnamomi]
MEPHTLTDSEMTIFLEKSPLVPTNRRMANCKCTQVAATCWTHALDDVEERVEPVEEEDAPDVGGQVAEELDELRHGERQEHERHGDEVRRGAHTRLAEVLGHPARERERDLAMASLDAMQT